MENFIAVQRSWTLADTIGDKKSARLRDFPRYPQASCMRRHSGDTTGARSVPINGAEKERPVRGDNRTGQSHMGAWGGWALAPNTADGEG